MSVLALDEEAAVALLDLALRAEGSFDDRITGDRGTAGRLADLCGRLPLALRIAAALLRADPALGVGELADELGAERKQLKNSRHEDRAGPGAPWIAAALGLSYRRLTETAARVFRLLPVNPGPDISTAGAAVLADLQVNEARRVLSGLARAYLIQAAPAGEGWWRMTDPVRRYAQQLSDIHAEADRRERRWDQLLGYYLRMATAADAHVRALPGVALLEEFTSREAALDWLDVERPNLIAVVQMAAAAGRDQAAMRLPLLLAQYFAWRRRFDDLIETTTVSLNAARRLGDRSREGDALTNLGGALLEVHRFEEAIAVHQNAAAIYRESGDCHSMGHALNNLGVALMGMLRFEEAITAHQDAVTIYRNSGDRHSQGNALNNLGLALKGMLRFDEAIAACQEAAAIYLETDDRHSQGLAVNNLGIALREVGRFEEAVTVHQRAATIFRETGDRYREDIALENLARAQVA